MDGESGIPWLVSSVVPQKTARQHRMPGVWCPLAGALLARLPDSQLALDQRDGTRASHQLPQQTGEFGEFALAAK